MSTQHPTGESLESQIKLLASKDGGIRQSTRRALVALGEPAVLLLIAALQSSKSQQVRWEAAKALGAIGDSRSIPALVEALEDADGDVRWLAAEALRKFEEAAWPVLLRRLSEIEIGTDSSALRQGAHHVLRHQDGHGLDDLLVALVAALEPNADPSMTVTAATTLFRRLP